MTEVVQGKSNWKLDLVRESIGALKTILMEDNKQTVGTRRNLRTKRELEQDRFKGQEVDEQRHLLEKSAK